MSTGTERAIREWRNRVAAEYRSAAVTAQLLHLAIQVGLDDPLVDIALRIVRDELDHAALAHGVVVALGGDEAPAPVALETLAEPAHPDGPVATLLDSGLRNFCLGETFAVPLFAAMRRGTTEPAARAALDRILRDEAVHRAFGWDLLDALIALDPPAVRARVEAALPGALAGFRASYAERGPGLPLTDAERAVGLLDLTEYRRIHDETVRDLRRRFALREIALHAD